MYGRGKLDLLEVKLVGAAWLKDHQMCVKPPSWAPIDNDESETAAFVRRRGERSRVCNRKRERGANTLRRYLR